MTRSEFNAFCESLPATTKVVQWGGAHVWKVGGKIFAISSHWGKDDGIPGDPNNRISFKCRDFSYQLLIEQDGIVPAPYLARAKWVQVEDQSALTTDELKAYISAAHDIIASKLTKKARVELGLEDRT
ncbi:MAG: MmcQ/YjbR family DNA-binding protein [Pseudomonadota bacterium]